MKYIKLKNIIFYGKQGIPWNEVEKYIKMYSGSQIIVQEYQDRIVINSKSADEYTESKYTKKLRGALAKVNANVVQILPELITYATNRRWVENKAEKHYVISQRQVNLSLNCFTFCLLAPSGHLKKY